MIYKKNNKDHFSLWQSLQLASNLGFIICLPMLIFTFIGYLLDKNLGSKPIITLICILIGTITGIYSAFKEINKMKL